MPARKIIVNKGQLFGLTFHLKRVSSRLEPKAERRDLLKIDSSTEFTLSAVEWAFIDSRAALRLGRALCRNDIMISIKL